MMHIAETLATHSAEGFLTPQEVKDLNDIMDAFFRVEPRQRFEKERTQSIHEIPGHTADQAMEVYEPQGRIEVSKPPQVAEEILQKALARTLHELRRPFPSITSCRPWTYVEYGSGQHITPHLDGISPDPLAWPRQVAGIGVVVEKAKSGGEFFVETTSDPRMWSELTAARGDGYLPEMTFAHDGADNSSPWYREMARTRWTTDPALGTALVYGSQLTHGTEPVHTGRAKKFISWLFADLKA